MQHVQRVERVGILALNTVAALLTTALSSLGQQASHDTLRHGAITGFLQPTGVAAVVVIHKDTTIRMAAVDSLTGRFEVSQLPVGTYRLYIQAEYAGKRYVVQGLDVQAKGDLGRDEYTEIQTLLTRLRDAVARKNLTEITACYSKSFRNPEGVDFSQLMNFYRELVTDRDVVSYSYQMEVVDMLRVTKNRLVGSIYKEGELHLKDRKEKIRSNEVVFFAKEGAAWKITSETKVGLFAPVTNIPESLEFRVTLRPPLGSVTVTPDHVTDCGTISVLEFFKGKKL